MRVYYPGNEEKKDFKDRKPVIASMTVHTGAKIDRFWSDSNPIASKKFEQGKSPVAMIDESLVLPPYNYTTKVPKDESTNVPKDESTEVPYGQSWNQGYMCTSKLNGKAIVKKRPA